MQSNTPTICFVFQNFNCIFHFAWLLQRYFSLKTAIIIKRGAVRLTNGDFKQVVSCSQEESRTR
jgi:hypothetical protein